ncbi:MAG: hypothetical protein NZ534_06170 [Bacteroidia bacterium]|nr:hypothetical protein [Bacteroidia bacterium]
MGWIFLGAGCTVGEVNLPRYLLWNMTHRIKVFAALMLWAATATAQNLKPLQESKAVLQETQKHYDRAAQKDPKNKVAKHIAEEVKNALVALDAYIAGKKTKKDLGKALDKALIETKKSSQPEAQKAQKALTSAKNALTGLPEVVKPKPAPPKVPEVKPTPPKPTENAPVAEAPPIVESPPTDSETPAPEDELTGIEDVRDLESDAGPTVAVGPRTATESGGRFGLYVLLTLNFVATITAAFLIWTWVKKVRSKLEARLSKTEATIEGMQFNVPNVGETVKIGQFETRVSTLEANVFAFMERLEERMAAIENRMRDLSAPAGPVRIEEEAPVALHLPEGAHKELTAALEELRETAAPDVAADVEKIIETLRFGTPDVKRLALLLQYAYVQSFYRLDDGGFSKLYEALKPLGFLCDDKMQGRMAFSDFYARNVGLKAYATAREFHTSDFPPPEAAQKAAKEMAARPEALPKTILFTLRPTVRLLRDGAKIVLAKGAYIVND